MATVVNEGSFNPVTALRGTSVGVNRLSVLDGLRGVAALLVFTRHAWGFAGHPRYGITNSFSLDWFFVQSRAVDLFFILSAFLLGGQFFRSAIQGRTVISTKSFLFRRFVRIFPAYWLILVLLLTVFVPWLVSSDDVYSGKGFLAFIGFIPALSNVFPWSSGKFFVISPVWTLTHELTFYLLLPLIWPLFRSRRWKISLVVSTFLTFGWLFFIRTSFGIDFADSVGQMANSSLDGPDLGRIFLVNQFPSFVFSFALGTALSSIWANTQNPDCKKSLLARHPQKFLYLGLLISLVSMGFLGRLTINNGFEDVFALARDTSFEGTVFYYLEHTLTAVGFFFILSGVVFTDRPLRILNWNWLRALGILGYGVFLIHFPVLYVQDNLSWLDQISPAFRFPVAWVIGLVTTIGLAIVLWFAVERPVIAFSHRHKEKTKSSLLKQEIE